MKKSSKTDTPRRQSPMARLWIGPCLLVAAVGIVFASLMALNPAWSSASSPKVTNDAAVLRQGQVLFNQHCSSCHGAGGTGSSIAPELITAGPAAADFYLETGRMPLNAADNQAIRHHRLFTQTQIDALDSYINSLAVSNKITNVQGIPTIDPMCNSVSDANLAAQKAGKSNCVTLSFGAQTYALNCSQCHQIAGRGGLLSKANVIPSLQNASSLEAAEAIRIGPGPMPVFGVGQLNQTQMSAVAAYVEYLKTPQHPGGLTISGWGPVAEGFVGIVVGLGALLFFSRLIGTRG